MTIEDSIWTLLAPVYEELFPLRPARVEMVRGLCAPGGVFLDAGCASGALVRAVAAAGRRAFGFDLDDELVELARRRSSGMPTSYAAADLRDVGSVFEGERFGLVACLGQTFPHLLEDADVNAFLGGCAGRLEREGILLLQVMGDETGPTERDLPELGAAGFTLRRRRIRESCRRARLELRVEGGGASAERSVTHRVWTPDELAAFAAPLGYARVATWSDESGSEWNGSGSSWILVLRRAERVL